MTQQTLLIAETAVERLTGLQESLPDSLSVLYRRIGGLIGFLEDQESEADRFNLLAAAQASLALDSLLPQSLSPRFREFRAELNRKATKNQAGIKCISDGYKHLQMHEREVYFLDVFAPSQGCDDCSLLSFAGLDWQAAEYAPCNRCPLVTTDFSGELMCSAALRLTVPEPRPINMRRQLLREFLVEGVSHRELMPVSIPASCPLAQLLVQEVEDIPDTVAELREAAEDI